MKNVNVRILFLIRNIVAACFVTCVLNWHVKSKKVLEHLPTDKCFINSNSNDILSFHGGEGSNIDILCLYAV
jgi:hypothetical protein